MEIFEGTVTFLYVVTYIHHWHAAESTAKEVRIYQFVRVLVYTVSQKKVPTFKLSVTLSYLNQF